MYVVLVAAIVAGLATTVLSVVGGHEDVTYRETVSPWFRSLFYFSPEIDSMAAAPLAFQMHTLIGMLLFAIWPFTRLVHAFTVPAALPVPPLHRLPEPRRPGRAREPRRPTAAGPRSARATAAETPENPTEDRSSHDAAPTSGTRPRPFRRARPRTCPGARSVSRSRSGRGTSSRRSACGTAPSSGLNASQNPSWSPCPCSSAPWAGYPWAHSPTATADG